jgi:DNA polymerase III subunit alpha
MVLTLRKAKAMSKPLCTLLAKSLPCHYGYQMSDSPFIHLRVQSAYSLLEGAMHPKDIVSTCLRFSMPAVAVTDRNNLFGAMEFGDAAQSLGIQPIMGATVSIRRPGKAVAYDSLILLAQNAAGYQNLSALVSAAHMEADAGDPPHITLEHLQGRSDDMIALSAGCDGALYKLLASEQQDAAEAYCAALEPLFEGRLYIELNRIGDRAEALAEPLLIDLAYARNLPLVACNPVLFESPKSYGAHDILFCIQQGTVEADPDRKRLNEQLWFKSQKDMLALFRDVPEALDNTAVIAKRCAVKAPSRNPILPNFSKTMAEADVLRAQAAEGLAARIAQHGITNVADYHARLDFELDVIIQMGFPGYFLIVADFIGWAKQADIPVGPGRGSGAGSLVAWSLKITDLDPIRLGLLFERFLNPERKSMPDFDIDFCETRRGEVIRYVQEKYGRDSVAQIITFGKLKARAVIKDVGRALHMPYGLVDGLSKMIPNHPASSLTLAQAVKEVPELRQKAAQDADVRRLVDIAMQLEGLYRHASTHAAGVVIGDRPLEQLVPLYRDPRSDMPVTQFDMKWVEKSGLVKFDFLGLKTLSVLKRAVDLLARRGVVLNLDNIPWDDKPSYDLMARGDTVGVFQLESEGMRRTLSLVRPDKFEDIIALVSLYRPGPMENIPSFANRKHGKEAPDYLHPLLEPVLRETYGVIIYQEQVMQIAQILSGYSLGQADLLRRAMGKKIQAEMDAQRATFVDGAKAKGVAESKASTIFDLVDKFAGYGFNKSHAAAYALVAYQTAYLKANYPVEFFAASMAYDITNTDKLAVFADDMKRSNTALLMPDINASEADFNVEPHADGFAVRYALAALKGVGEKAMEALVDERKNSGPYKSFGDLAARLDARGINKRQLESLASGGAFDCLVSTRAQANAMVDTVLSHASAAAASRASTQTDMFGGTSSNLELLVPTLEPWPIAKQMAMEKDAIGYYLSAHPLDAFGHILGAHNAVTGARALELEKPAGGKRSVTLAGIAEEARVRPSKSGGQYALLNMSDPSGQFQLGCFDPALVHVARSAASTQEPILVRAELIWRDGEDTPRINAREITPLTELVANHRTDIDIYVRDAEPLEPIARLMEAARGGRGQARLVLLLENGSTEATVHLRGQYRIDPALRGALMAQVGIVDARLS